MGSDFLLRGGDPEGFARSQQRADLAAGHGADYDVEDDFSGRRPSFAGQDGVEGIEGAQGGRGSVAQLPPLIAQDDADSERSESLASGYTRNSLGLVVRRQNTMDRWLGMMGGEKSAGGASHRRGRPWKQLSQSYELPESGEVGAEAGQAPAQRAGFFNGSWNPFKWNWRNLFGRRR